MYNMCFGGCDKEGNSLFCQKGIKNIPEEGFYVQDEFIQRISLRDGQHRRPSPTRQFT
jgi:hypothetical protein